MIEAVSIAPAIVLVEVPTVVVSSTVTLAVVDEVTKVVKVVACKFLSAQKCQWEEHLDRNLQWHALVRLGPLSISISEAMASLVNQRVDEMKSWSLILYLCGKALYLYTNGPVL